jgi:hypothetical protein
MDLEIHSRSKNQKILPIFVTQWQRVNRVLKTISVLIITSKCQHKFKIVYIQSNNKKNNKKSVIIIRLGVMVLQALLDVNLTLFNTLSNKINFTLESSHGWHQLSKCNLYIKSRGHSLGWWCNCWRGNWWRLRNTALSHVPQLSIRLHESLYAKGIWNPWAGSESEISVTT